MDALILHLRIVGEKSQPERLALRSKIVIRKWQGFSNSSAWYKNPQEFRPFHVLPAQNN